MLLSEMCEVERGQLFTTENYKDYEFRVESCGGVEHIEYRPELGEWRDVKLTMLENIINLAPEGIIHLPPPLTDEKREQLKALWTLGYRWLAQDRDNNVYAYGNIKPIKECDGWGTSNGEFARIHEWMHEGAVASLVSWSDPEPYDIGKALGVEV